ncbi:MAG: hypothetical protein WBE13_04425 [Candidatus Acidiferrum sp.]
MSPLDNDKLPASISFHWIKSQFFRVIHADGAFGGLTPQGDIFLSVFNERAPLPDVTVQAVENGQLGPEITEKRVGKEGIIRELEVGLVMDLRVAKSVRDWLQQRIEVLEQLQQSQNSGQPVEETRTTK